MIFNGKNITDAKSIDVSMNSSVITSDMSVGNYVKEGILLDFASNGNLPGTASVRIKTTDDMSNLLNKKVFVYYFDPSINKFTYIDEITQNSEDDYYEFDITHTSSYILVNEKLDDSLVVTQTDGNKIIQDNKTLWILVALSAVVIIIVTLIIIKEVKKKKDSKNSK
jgi:hypothetical protein